MEDDNKILELLNSIQDLDVFHRFDHLVEFLFDNLPHDTSQQLLFKCLNGTYKTQKQLWLSCSKKTFFTKICKSTKYNFLEMFFRSKYRDSLIRMLTYHDNYIGVYTSLWIIFEYYCESNKHFYKRMFDTLAEQADVVFDQTRVEDSFRGFPIYLSLFWNTYKKNRQFYIQTKQYISREIKRGASEHMIKLEVDNYCDLPVNFDNHIQHANEELVRTTNAASLKKRKRVDWEVGVIDTVGMAIKHNEDAKQMNNAQLTQTIIDTLPIDMDLIKGKNLASKMKHKVNCISTIIANAKQNKCPIPPSLTCKTYIKQVKERWRGGQPPLKRRKMTETTL